MKNYSNWGFAFIIGGLIFSLGSFIRYYIIFPDLDRAIVYTTIGLLISGFGFIYNKFKEIHYKMDAMGDYLNDISDKFVDIPYDIKDYPQHVFTRAEVVGGAR